VSQARWSLGRGWGRYLHTQRQALVQCSGCGVGRVQASQQALRGGQRASQPGGPHQHLVVCVAPGVQLLQTPHGLALWLEVPRSQLTAHLCAPQPHSPPCSALRVPSLTYDACETRLHQRHVTSCGLVAAAPSPQHTQPAWPYEEIRMVVKG
jgi:hypothetical protein